MDSAPLKPIARKMTPNGSSSNVVRLVDQPSSFEMDRHAGAASTSGEPAARTGGAQGRLMHLSTTRLLLPVAGMASVAKNVNNISGNVVVYVSHPSRAFTVRVPAQSWLATHMGTWGTCESTPRCRLRTHFSCG